MTGFEQVFGCKIKHFLIFFLSTKEKSMSDESTCNRCSLMLMGPNNNTIHVIYFVPLSTNPSKGV